VSKLTRNEAARLLSQVAKGQEDAFMEIYTALQPSVRRWLQGQGNLNSPDIEDIVQEVFTELWLKPLDYDPARSELTTWLITQAGRRKTDLWRKKSIRNEFEELPLGEDCDEWNPYQELIDFTMTHVESEEIRTWFDRCLQQLNAQEQEAVKMRLFEGAKVKDYARLNGLAESTFRRNANKGYALMQECLSQLRPNGECHEPN